ncbi:NADH-ubiquinone oxidoreductase-F iron-sulfur binding region domain-containing protein [Cryobacterium tagatosivorans]|uniref:NADH-ubiquinone oxidoreductase 51kDa subunit iron-sulphur binding domain-containing protein n=1 Tax=Cryobacterium tagatosivorans TaxID=1259199 RepID=A0A4R8UBH3_9MICO|nr:NADH-ubiquinone oxidoreductase-F iron-sulfur binding region domain-containing protein [Cryobacterium tagatosivorans]TFB46286.1 hypothetical protein E3O23_17675 [Cryobacterium tagatosivorans]
MSPVTQAVRPTVAAPAGTARLTSGRAPGFGSHLADFGPIPSLVAEGLLEELRASGLEGRGGAAFPAWRKIEAARARGRSRGRRAVVVGNAAEGEPLSSKDLTLLRMAPHLVIDGLLGVATTLDAGSIHLYGPESALPAVARALAERPDARAIDLRPSAETFVSGEASAVVSALAGRRPVPQDRTVRLTEAGLNGRPTLVHNVETLAQIALIARFGAAWFRSVGTATDPGTRLVTVSGDVASPGVLEIAGGTRIGDLLGFAGADTAALSAVLVGGYHGAWVPAAGFSANLAREQLAPFGAAVGAGILMALDARRCPLTLASSIAGYLAGETAGQCGPCVNGLPAMAEVLHRLARGDRNAGLPAEVRRLAELVTGRGSCHHPDGTARFVLSTLTVFAEDVAAHLGGRCAKDHS